MVSQTKSVTFKEGTHIFYYVLDKRYNYIEGRTKMKKQNRKLRKVERYMKKVNLLNHDEMLQFTKIHSKHIRGDYINFIAKERKMIKKKEYLKIIT